MKSRRFSLTWLVSLSLATLASPPALAGDRQCPLKGDSRSALQELCSVVDGLARIRIGHAWGFVDAQGRVVVAPQFEEVEDFSEGLARIKKDDRYGFIDKTGRVVIEPQLEYADDFSSGLALAWLGGRRGFIDKTGRWVVPAVHDDARSFHGSVGAVKGADELWSLIDPRGQVIKRLARGIELEYPVESGGLWHAKRTFEPRLRHVDGRSAPLSPHANSYHFNQGLVPVRAPVMRGDEKRWLQGLQDLQGRWVLPPQFSEIQAVRDGLAIATPEAARGAEPRAGLVNLRGEWVVPARYARIEQGPGYRATRTDKGLDVLSRKGRVLIELPCDDANHRQPYVASSPRWAMYTGCGKAWLVIDGEQAVALRDGSIGREPRMWATADHLLVQWDGDESAEPKTPGGFRLFDAKGRALLSSADAGLSGFSAILVQSAGQLAHATPQLLPLLILVKDEEVRLVTREMKVVADPAWIDDYSLRQFGEAPRDTPREGPLPMRTENGWGAVDGQGRWVVAPTYRKIEPFSHGLSVARTARKSRLLDRDGKQHALPEDTDEVEIVAPFTVEGRDSDTESFVRFNVRTGQLTRWKLPEGARAEALAGDWVLARKDDRWGLLTADGKWALPPSHENRLKPARDDSGRLVGWVVDRDVKTRSGTDTLHGWLSPAGREILPPLYDDLTFKPETGLLHVRRSPEGSGLIAPDGRVIVEPVNDKLDAVGDGWYATQPQHQEGLLDARGEWALSPRYGYLEGLRTSPYVGQWRNGELEFIDRQGRVSTRARPLHLADEPSSAWWSEEEGPYDERERVYRGFDFKERLRLKGEVPGYEPRFSEGVLAFTPQEPTREKRTGLIDEHGKVIGLYPFHTIGPMTKGFALVSRALSKPAGPKGRARPPSSDEEDDEAGNKRGLRFGYLDRQGKLAIPPSFEAARDFSEERAVVLLRGNLGLIDTQGRLLLHSAWMCGREPVLLNGKEQVIWPEAARSRRKC
jgi:hypothetical protein